MSRESGLDLILSIIGEAMGGSKEAGDDMTAFMTFKKLLCSGARVDTGRPIRRLLL